MSETGESGGGQRLAEAERLRAAVEAAGPLPPPRLRAEMDAHFDRIMKLLARHDREPRRPDRHGSRGPWTFEQAILALEKRLRAVSLLKDEPRKARGGDADGEPDIQATP
jgi:hypothetical protein